MANHKENTVLLQKEYDRQYLTQKHKCREFYRKVDGGVLDNPLLGMFGEIWRQNPKAERKELHESEDWEE